MENSRQATSSSSLLARTLVNILEWGRGGDELEEILSFEGKLTSKRVVFGGVGVEHLFRRVNFFFIPFWEDVYNLCETSVVIHTLTVRTFIKDYGSNGTNWRGILLTSFSFWMLVSVYALKLVGWLLVFSLYLSFAIKLTLKNWVY